MVACVYYKLNLSKTIFLQKVNFNNFLSKDKPEYWLAREIGA